MSDDPEQDMDELAAELAVDAAESFESNKQEQQAFLDTVSEERGTEVLETDCTLIGDYEVPVKAKLNGKIMDRMEALDDRMARLSAGDGRVSETADEVSQLLADLIDDPEYNKRLFYQVYENEGLQAIGEFLKTVFESLKEERKRRRRAADGFRQRE